jgi:hypothetical protein
MAQVTTTLTLTANEVLACQTRTILTPANCYAKLCSTAFSLSQSPRLNERFVALLDRESVRWLLAWC